MKAYMTKRQMDLLNEKQLKPFSCLLNILQNQVSPWLKVVIITILEQKQKSA